MREELRQLIKPQLPTDWLNMNDKISTGDWEVFAYDPIAWLHFCIRDDRGPLNRAELIETANLLLNRPIVEQDNVLPPPPAAGDIPPEGEPRFQDLWLQIGAARAYTGRD